MKDKKIEKQRFMNQFESSEPNMEKIVSGKMTDEEVLKMLNTPLPKKKDKATYIDNLILQRARELNMIKDDE